MTVAEQRAIQVMPARGSRHLSFSAVSLFQSCPLRYYFRYVAGLPEGIVSASLVFGSAMHRAVQHHFEQLLMGRPPPGIDELLGSFRECWQQYRVPIRFNKGDDLNSIGHLADRLLRHFQKSSFAQPVGTIIGVEEELRGPLMPGLPELLGRVDLLVETEEALFLSDSRPRAPAGARSRWRTRPASSCCTASWPRSSPLASVCVSRSRC